MGIRAISSGIVSTRHPYRVWLVRHAFISGGCALRAMAHAGMWHIRGCLVGMTARPVDGMHIGGFPDYRNMGGGWRVRNRVSRHRRMQPDHALAQVWRLAYWAWAAAFQVASSRPGRAAARRVACAAVRPQPRLAAAVRWCASQRLMRGRLPGEGQQL